MKENCQTRRMFGHDYAIPGTYEVTVVVAGRHPVFGEVLGTTKAGGPMPYFRPSALGQAVLSEEIPKIHHYYPMVDVWQVCLMPDHIHLIVRINQPLPKGKHLGIIIGAFKGGVSRVWWRLTGATSLPSGTPAPSLSSCPAAAAPTPGLSSGHAAAAPAPGLSSCPAAAAPTSGLSSCPAAAAPTAGLSSGATVSVASASDTRAPLFEPNYNDHILMRDGQLENWKQYLRDNPRRLMMRREYPRLFQRSLCITIGGTRYSAFGNLLLLRQPEKEQVFFHRYTDGVRTENTPFWTTERERLLSAAMSGDVLVTPGISECEKRMKNMALEQGLRLIHVQAEPIGQYWKPERSRFEACTLGTLLILAPWPEDMPAFATDYDRFHYLNRLAEIVCSISLTTSVSVRGL